MPEKPDIPLAMIVAMAQNRVIGSDNQLPWHLPNDLKHFKTVTLGKPIIMGRKTYESLGNPLPGRSNIVVTGNKHFSSAGVQVAHSITEAVALARQIAHADHACEVMVIGGAQLYREMLADTQRLYLTQVMAEVPGDAYFPEVDWGEWQIVEQKVFEAKKADALGYKITLLERI